MASNCSWFAMFWMFSTGFSLGSRRAGHPLCRALEHRDKHQPTDFSSKYICIGDGADALCTPWNPNSSDARAKKVGNQTHATIDGTLTLTLIRLDSSLDQHYPSPKTINERNIKGAIRCHITSSSQIKIYHEWNLQPYRKFFGQTMLSVSLNGS